MAYIQKDRVLETSTTTGTGSLTVAGAMDTFRTFGSVCTTGDVFEYFVKGAPGTGEWETGLGTYSGTNTIARTTVVESSNANAAVNFSAGSKQVGIAPLGSRYPGLVPSWATRPTPPLSANYTLFKDAGTTASLADKSRGVLISVTGAGAADRLACLENNTPGSTWTLTACIQGNAPLRRYVSWGPYVRDSSTGRLNCFHFAVGGSTSTTVVPQLRVTRFNSITSYNADTATIGMLMPGNPIWFRLTLDATNLVFATSGDGENFSTNYQIAKNDWCATIDRVGVNLAVNHTDSGTSGHVNSILVMSHSLA